MYNYTDEQIASFSALAVKKGADAEIHIGHFTPADCDADESISVAWRSFTKQEFASYINAGEGVTSLVNASIDIVLSIDGVSDGAVLPGEVRRLANMMDRSLASICDIACHIHGAALPVQWGKLRSQTTDEEVARFGLDPSVKGLLEKHRDPGALRMVRIGDLVSLVIVRPAQDVWLRAAAAAASSKKAHEAYRDLATDHIVWPASREERNKLFTQWCGLGLGLFNLFGDMRTGGAKIEGKGLPRGSGAPGI